MSSEEASPTWLRLGWSSRWSRPYSLAFGFGNPAVRIEVIALAIVSLLRDEPEATLERADATSSI